MELHLLFFLAILAFYSSYLKGVLRSLTQDEVDKLHEKYPIKSNKLNYIWDNYDKFSDTLFIFKFLNYFLIAVIFGASFLVKEFLLIEKIAIVVVLLHLLVFFDYLFYYFGKKSKADFIINNLFFLSIYSYLVYPFYLIKKKLSEWIKGKTTVEEESWIEIEEAVESAREEGSLDDDEYRILKNVMKFSDILVSDVMTPRTVVFSCNANNTVEQTVFLPEIRMYSRFPIWEGEALDDGVIGYVMSRDILYAALKGEKNLPLRNFKRDVYYIPENATLDAALDMFLKRNQHLFIVVDEYGGIEGLITMEDVLETILGTEIVDEADKVIDMRQLAKQRRDKRVSNFTEKKVNN